MRHDETPVLPGSNLRWYLNRLRCMPPAEIPFRMRRALANRVERMRPGSRAAAAPDLSRRGAAWMDSGPNVDVERYLRAADRVAAGRLDVFELRAVDLGDPPRWNRDPKTGIEAPMRFGKLLDYRDPELVGDIKYLWEPNRHLQLVTLAQAYALSGDAHYGQVLLQQLQSWFAACPYRMGPNWSSALEPALRLINWSIAWQLLGGVNSELFDTPSGSQARDEWLESIHQHVEFVRGYHSLHSSANNHLIGEAAGVFVAALTWPHWRQSRLWAERARALLLREALLQNAPDGVNREQAMCYQQFELDMLLIAWLAGRAGGMPLPAEYDSRLTAMLEFVASVMDAGGNLPMFGDADDGRVVSLSQEPNFHPYRSLLATGATLFGRADFKPAAAWLDDKTRWLCGSVSESLFAGARATGNRTPLRRAFPDGGYFILGAEFDTSNEIMLVADAGPLGYGPLAAHGHADALSFTLSLGGQEFLVDPGTFTYRADSPWRAYFRGTSAHNTLRIDGQDQSLAGGSFLWLRKAHAECTRWSSDSRRDVMEGWHDGYTGLADAVLHRRRIMLDKARRQIVIEDQLEMQASHLVELFFHFAADCQISGAGPRHEVRRSPGRLQMTLPESPLATTRLCRGQNSPPLGWISRSYDQMQPAPTLVWSAKIAGSTLLRTVIDC